MMDFESDETQKREDGYPEPTNRQFLIFSGILMWLIIIMAVSSFYLVASDASDERQNSKTGTSKSLSDRVGPAPSGGAIEVAQSAIDKARQHCGTITSASRRRDDGSILARCSNGREYRIFSFDGVGTVAHSIKFRKSE